MEEISAPTNKEENNIFGIIIIVLIVIGLVTIGYLHFAHKVLNVTNKGVYLTNVTNKTNIKSIVKVSIIQPTKEVITPKINIVPKVIKTPSLPVLTSSQAVSTVHSSGSYMNHGNFVHGNSNPSWPYHNK